MVRRTMLVLGLTLTTLVAGGGAAAWACGGLVAPGHAEVLRKATTLAAWHAGYEHYVTGFEFAGAAQTFGYIVPLPGVPTRIEKGGDWTLERLEREVTPQVFAEALDAAGRVPAASVQVIQKVTIDALDITIVRGGGADVAKWASRNGFPLTQDAPKVLGAYTSSGAIFALAKFDRAAAAQRGVIEGQGQTIHFVIPTKGPWIPLRILALGKAPVEEVDADLFLLTDHEPTLWPTLRGMPGMHVRRSAWASPSLLRDLRSDRGMSWVPRNMWFTALQLDTQATAVRYDLSADGARPASAARTDASSASWWPIGVAAAMALSLVAVAGALWPRRPEVTPA